MKNVHVVGVLCGLALSSFVFGCASSGATAPLKTSPPTAAAAAATPSQMADELWIGPTRGESSDANVLAWQTDLLKAIKSATDKPLCVGFGISSPAHVAQVAAIADGAVVGSALVDFLDKNAADPDRDAKLTELVAGWKAGTKR